MNTYSHIVSWKNFWGDQKTTVRSENHPTPESAREAAVRMARKMGWTPPQWWQFWRWDEPVREG